MVELAAIDHADRAELLAELVLASRPRPPRPGAPPAARDDLDRHRAEAAGAAPHEHRIARLHDVRRPAVQHAIRGRADEHVRRGLFPRQVRRLRHALVVLHLACTARSCPSSTRSPRSAGVGANIGSLPATHARIVGVPHAAVDDDVVADLDVRDVLADRPHDAARVAAADVEVLGLALLLARLDDVDRDAHRRPHVVVVDARGHHVDEHVVRRRAPGSASASCLNASRGSPKRSARITCASIFAGTCAELGDVAELVEVVGGRWQGL